MKDKRSFSFSKINLNGSDSGLVLPNALMSRSFITKEVGAHEHSTTPEHQGTQTARDTCYLWGCCFYNCCCCCFDFCGVKWAGPCCGDKFMFNGALICWKPKLRRTSMLRLLHLSCFLVHTTWATLSWVEGYGKPMEVQLYRVKPMWQNTGRDGYTYEVFKVDWKPRIDTVTTLFEASGP